MKEIKFRCWDIERKRMRGVADIKWFDNGNIRVNATESDKNYEPLLYMKEYQGSELKEFELMQYAGLTDKNGKEIYEGDILCVSGYSYEEPEDDWEGEVVMGSFGWGISGTNSCGDNSFYYLNEIGGSYTTVYEILGNKFENPELLED